MKRHGWWVVAILATGLWVVPTGEAREPPTKKTEEIVCPVMGMPVRDPATAPKSEYQGRTWYFCCPSCKEKFDQDPARYVGGADGRKGGGDCGAGTDCRSDGHGHR